jgi:hypothetical protein
MEEKVLKLVAQLGLVALVIWVICTAFSIGTPAPAAPQSAPRRNIGPLVGDLGQRGGVVAPYAQPSFRIGSRMSVI